MLRFGERTMRRLLRGPEANRWGLGADALRLASQTAYWQMRAFYLIAFLAAFDFLRWVYRSALSGLESEPLWPVFWVDWVGLETSGRIIGLFFLLACFAALWRHGSTWPRVLVFIGLLQYVALDNSFGSINHSAHYLIWISFILMFMPRGPAPRPGSSPTRHHSFILGIFFAQCFIALFYSLSGLYKFLGGIFVLPGYVSSFDPIALPLLVLGRWAKTGKVPMFSEFFANNMYIAWPAHLLVIYFELFFLLAVFRPQLHRIYGFTLATFHVGVWLTMGITFKFQPVLVALLFIWSPLAYFDRATLRQRLAQMPLIDIFCCLAKLFTKGRKAAVKGADRSL